MSMKSENGKYLNLTDARCSIYLFLQEKIRSDVNIFSWSRDSEEEKILL